MYQKDYKNVSLPITVKQPHSKAAELKLDLHKLQSSWHMKDLKAFYGQNSHHLLPNHILPRKRDQQRQLERKAVSQAGSGETCNGAFPGRTQRQKSGKFSSSFSVLKMANTDQNNEHS